MESQLTTEACTIQKHPVNSHDNNNEETNIITESSSSSSSVPRELLRGNARTAMAEKWAYRRRQKQQQNIISSTSTDKSTLRVPPKDEKEIHRSLSTNTNTNTGINSNVDTNMNTNSATTSRSTPLCTLIRRSWKDAMKSFPSSFVSFPNDENNQHLKGLGGGDNTNDADDDDNNDKNKNYTKTTFQSNNSKKNHHKQGSSTRTSQHQRTSFPSVLNVLQANTIKQQVLSLQRQEAAAASAAASTTNKSLYDNGISSIEYGEGNQSDSLLSSQQQQKQQQQQYANTFQNMKKRQPSLLKVLPSKDHDFSHAIMEMTKRRSRVFWLLDLATIVQAYVKCRKDCQLNIIGRSGSKGVGQDGTTNIHNTQTKNTRLEFAYRLHHNANPKLLHFIHGLGMVLQVSTKYDVDICRQVQEEKLKEERETATMSSSSASSFLFQIQDDPNIVSKPNSFYRKLLLDDHFMNEHQDSSTTGSFPITIDGPNEMKRIGYAMSTMVSRRQQQQQQVENKALSSLSFNLKLPVSSGESENDFENWKQIWDDCQETSSASYTTSTKMNTSSSSTSFRHFQMVGLALALPTETERLEQCLSDLTLLLEHISDRNASSPSLPSRLAQLTQEEEQQQRLKLSLCIPTPVIDSKLIQWLSHNKRSKSLLTKVCESITIDISHVLVNQKASALCTRIIGVKENNEVSTEEDSKDINKSSNSNSSNKIHYYIDDGCYGSLSNIAETNTNEKSSNCKRTKRNQPIPFQASNRHFPSLSNNTETKEEPQEAEKEEEQSLLKATVWGPTCDGLDKVCQDIDLPRLSRDDWLVFSDIGFCNVGTSFNGFDPPDIAFCVLGNSGYYANPPDPIS